MSINKPTHYDIVQDQRPLNEIEKPSADIDLNGKNISNVGTIDGIDVSAHVSASTLVHGIDDTSKLTLVDGTRDFTAVVKYSVHPTFSSDTQLVDKKYVDDSISVENLWDRDAINGYLYPHTLTDKVGIGKNNPSEILDVLGNIAVTGTVDGLDISTHDHSAGAGSQVDHVDLASIGTNTHAQIDTHISATMSVHGIADTSDLVLKSGSLTQLTTRNHNDLQTIGANDHHNQQHILTGSDHTASGLTVGNVVRASGATTFAWAQLAHGDLSDIGTNTHSAIDTHIAATTSVHGIVNTSDLVLMSGSITQLTTRNHNDLQTIGANDHHNQIHVLVSSDHTASGLTVGYVVRASGATTFAWAQLQHNDLGSLTTGDDHTQYALLAGRSGGQTLYGGTLASNNLVLDSTSNATKGVVQISGSILDMNTHKIINVVNPTALQDVATKDYVDNPGFTTGYIYNLTTEYTSASQITIQTGIAKCDDDTFTLRLTSTKVVDITVAGAGGLDTGSEAASTWYYIWLIYNPTTTTYNGLLSTSSTSPSMPSGYTKKRLIGAVRNDSSSNFRPFKTIGKDASKRQLLLSSFTSRNQTSPSGITWTASVDEFVPPIAKRAAISMYNSGKRDWSCRTLSTGNNIASFLGAFNYSMEVDIECGNEGGYNRSLYFIQTGGNATVDFAVMAFYLDL